MVTSTKPFHFCIKHKYTHTISQRLNYPCFVLIFPQYKLHAKEEKNHTSVISHRQQRCGKNITCEKDAVQLPKVKEVIPRSQNQLHCPSWAVNPFPTLLTSRADQQALWSSLLSCSKFSSTTAALLLMWEDAGIIYLFM